MVGHRAHRRDLAGQHAALGLLVAPLVLASAAAPARLVGLRQQRRGLHEGTHQATQSRRARPDLHPIVVPGARRSCHCGRRTSTTPPGPSTTPIVPPWAFTMPRGDRQSEAGGSGADVAGLVAAGERLERPLPELRRGIRQPSSVTTTVASPSPMPPRSRSPSSRPACDGSRCRAGCEALARAGPGHRSLPPGRPASITSVTSLRPASGRRVSIASSTSSVRSTRVRSHLERAARQPRVELQVVDERRRAPAPGAPSRSGTHRDRGRRRRGSPRPTPAARRAACADRARSTTASAIAPARRRRVARPSGRTRGAPRRARRCARRRCGRRDRRRRHALAASLNRCASRAIGADST